ncbi:MAG: aminotransferase class V-fold PLP-dependent enzyme [Rubrivivax sp.]|nr:aminotransferase class V-fold PLP-dependent enzyme [Rubrivivax sp.]
MREHFLLDPDTVFLNHGSFGACPKPVFDEFQRWQLEMERNPVAFLGRRSGALLAAARERLAAYLGAQASDLVFVPNATTGVNTVAQSLALQPGDEVLATDHEYGACDATWRIACARAGATYRQVEIPLPFDSSQFVERLLAAVTPRTKLIFASHVTSATALIFPVAALCAAARERGIATLIDGAHAPGQLPLDLAAVGADFYTGNCHKWLCAPKGAAFLHVRPERQADVHATVLSWGYVAEALAQAHGNTAHFDAYTGSGLLERRLQWQGTRDIAACLAVPAAIDFQQQHGWPDWQRRCHDLACTTRARVAQHNGLPAAAPDAAFAQMVVIPVATDDPAALQRRLFEQHRIEVPVTQHAGRTFVRVSVQAYNTEADLELLVQALCPPRRP